MMVPKYADQPGYVTVDSTWGQIQPLEIAVGVQTRAAAAPDMQIAG